jgi:hypothetical protein
MPRVFTVLAWRVGCKTSGVRIVQMHGVARRPSVLPLVAGLLSGLLAGLSCGALEPGEMNTRPVPSACALVSKEDVSEAFGAAVEEGEPMSRSETSYCTFRFVGRDERVNVSVTPQVQSFARHAFLAGSAGERVRGLGGHASWNDDLLVVLHGATLYVSSTTPVSVNAAGSVSSSDRDKHVALAARALARLGE